MIHSKDLVIEDNFKPVQIEHYLRIWAIGCTYTIAFAGGTLECSIKTVLYYFVFALVKFIIFLTAGFA